MAVFWDAVFSPLLGALKPKRILEIGADLGTTTRLLLDYAEGHGSVVHVIDPRPVFDVDQLGSKHPDTFVFHRDLSLNVLPGLKPVDFALIDGDHNWYTVLNELRQLEQRASEKKARRLPVIALHDIEWPYGRRDLYYDPETIPVDKRRPFEVRGLRPDSAELVDDGLNSDLANATEPAERHSGVRGAIEDFMEESDTDWHLFEVPGEHGLGILVGANLLEEKKGVRELLESTQEVDFLRDRIDSVEQARIDTEIRRVGEAARASQAGAERDQAKREVAELERGLREVEGNRDRAQAELAAAQEEVTKGSKALASIQDNADEAKRQVQRLDRQREALENHEIALEDELAAAREELRQRQAAFEQISAELATRTDELAKAREAQVGLRAELTGEKKLRAAREQELERDSARLAAQKREQEGLRAEFALAARERRESELETGQQLQSLRAEIAGLTETVDALRELAESRGPFRRALRRINAGWRSASQMASWVFRRPSRDRLRYVSTYFALKRSGAFDAGFYLAHSPDVAGGGLNPLMHYIEHGAAEGRDPNPEFKTSEHLERHPRLSESGLNPLLHYLKYVGPAAPSEQDPTSAAAVPEVSPMYSRSEAKARRKFIARAIPKGATALIAGRVDPALLEPDGITALSFPRPAKGSQVDPAGSIAVMAQLASLRAEGAEYLVFPEAASEWLGRYPRFGRYLDRHYRTIASEDAGVVFDLRRQANGDRPWPGRFEELVQQHHARFGARPDILDWETNLKLVSRFDELTVIEPLVESSRLPYLADSIDLVVTAANQEQSHREEARRVAQHGLVCAREARGSLDFTVDWLKDASRRLPVVSIVIPTYDAVDLLEPCLAALAETLPEHLEAEVLVVDDGSSDGTATLISRWSELDDRVRHLRSEENRGFVASCNRAASEAEGEVLVFLNNDTIPMYGWLDPLIGTLLDRPDAGAVGGMLVYPNGTLQEAGAIVFSDGSGANFGKYDTRLDRPTYQFLREVDYCSGALLATRREVFAELGGFDALFEPCYYEDTDYCFRVRAAGLRTYYQPESVIVHLEGASSGTEAVPRGPKKYQDRNRLKFKQRWADVLRSQPSPPKIFDEAVWNQLARHRPPVETQE
jgi:GT2 family glycosyltransferase